METETIQAGYTMLHCIFTNNAFQCCKKVNGKYYFSNVLFKQRFLLDQKMLMVTRGPCLSNEQGDYDIAQALHSKLWISAANYWITRSKNVWPNLTPLHISLASYNYLSQNVVGSDYYVNIIRMMNAIRENLTRDDTCTTITSGSFGEGLGVRGSDLDILFILKDFEVSEDEIFYFKFSKTCFKLETVEVHPGYSRLRLMYTSDKKHLELCEKLYTKYYFSNALIKEWLLEFQVNTNLKSTHGPVLGIRLMILTLYIAYILHHGSYLQKTG
ncbi:unnamed protein product [Mytilus coruscus]|uniref:Uncharacterized protein n=1 Tax=Mytilus coruscus TaxID=42192 RepID=A0A6J8BB22_MYTCO|nr:unnamed protein product [Mytilus coruscus]